MLRPDYAHGGRSGHILPKWHRTVRSICHKNLMAQVWTPFTNTLAQNPTRYGGIRSDPQTGIILGSMRVPSLVFHSARTVGDLVRQGDKDGIGIRHGAGLLEVGVGHVDYMDAIWAALTSLAPSSSVKPPTPPVMAATGTGEGG